MVDREAMLRNIREMPIDELQNMICKALDDSGIAYQMGADGISLSDFFNGIFSDEETTEAIEISTKPANLTAKYISPDMARSTETSFHFMQSNNSFYLDHTPIASAA